MRLVVFAFLPLTAVAQDVVWQRAGQPAVNVVQDHVKFLGDVDGDGFDDLITRLYRFAGIVIYVEELHILSGRDGATLLVQPPPPGNNVTFDEWEHAGDMDGDGVPDYVFTAHELQQGYDQKLWMTE
jgi:hypothetical protein